LPEEWPTRSWNNPGDKPNNLRDYALFDTIVQTISDQYCIDRDEIYVVGHSLGWWFTNTLACARGDVIRAIWSVGGSSTKTVCSWPTSAIIMHHPDDNLASFAGGEWARNALLKQNQCWPETKPIWPEWWNCIEYTDCMGWSSVVWCPHSDSNENGRYYPHTWPDFAGQAIRDFFTDRL
jgi:polyhydroxybutyrate depolymerase